MAVKAHGGRCSLALPNSSHSLGGLARSLSRGAGLTVPQPRGLAALHRVAIT